MTPPALAGRVCLVTGATSGIGHATARELARLGARVVVHGRDAARAEAARERIRHEVVGADIGTLVCDLADRAAIREAANEMRRKSDALHVLVNNAGVAAPSRTATADGVALTLAVNYVAPVLLTQLLAPLLRSGAPARVVNVGSRLERMGRIRDEDPRSTRGYGTLRAYAQSKLALALFTYELAERWRETGITVNYVHPGGGATGIARAQAGWVRWLWERTQPPPEDAARTVVHAASATELAGVTGVYLEPPGRVGMGSPRSRDAAARARMWRVGQELAGLA